MIGSLLHNEKVRNVAAQAILLAAFAASLLWLVANTAENLSARGIRVGWDFLWRSANFPISESVLPYSPSDTFLWAIMVGIGNTLFLSVVVVVLATLLGTVVGLARRSANPLLSAVTGCFVTTARNTPLIVQLLFWYALLTTALPAPRQALNPFPGVYLSLRGIYVPSLSVDGNASAFWIGALVAAAAIVWVGLRFGRGRLSGRWLYPSLALGSLITAVMVAAAAGAQLSATSPELRGLNFTGGMRLSSEFAALMIGLVLYTSAFVGEIVRGGIDAVARGQWEAGRALGLTEGQILRKVVAPQALRVIIPPMTSQYVSAAKNTTLALAVGYPELGLVIGTVINQTGQAIESLLVLLGVFLAISLSVSGAMNWLNRKVALVQR
ncbi:ABC transporter permease subunit [Aureimonas sp. SK2]|uniref:amino acid ABC transporter permease n=1 Tax=Aureimonas sp. SK2 TaxID=3015992 RepID=UPI002444CB6B|nr:ABC transporter permease subunit [Aureimonas sp. SK2]